MKLAPVIQVGGCLAASAVIRLGVPDSLGLTVWVLACGIAFAYRGLVAAFESNPDIVLRLWGLAWTRDEACCHFFITGATGTGKTARAVVPVVHGLRKTLPDTGVLAVDSKGAL